MSKNLLLLVNPFSGKGNNIAVSAVIINFLVKENWQYFSLTSQYKNHFVSYLENAELCPFTHIGIVGGDGTMHEVMNGLMARNEKARLPIILFPYGTGNSFNHDLGCFSVETALQRLMKGNTQKIDIMHIRAEQEHFYAFNIVGFGIVNDINVLAESLRWLGSIRYTMASLIYIFKNRHYFACASIDDKVIDRNFCFIIVCNTMYTGKAMKMAPKALLSDGLLDVLVVNRLKVWQLLSLFPKIFSGGHVRSPLVEYIHAKSVKIYPKIKQIGNFDGEVKGFSPFEIDVLPLALEVVC